VYVVAEFLNLDFSLPQLGFCFGLDGPIKMNENVVTFSEFTYHKVHSFNSLHQRNK